MGNVWSAREQQNQRSRSPTPEYAPLPLSTNGNRRKRSREEISDDEVEELSPKRKKIQITSSYIYDTLFKKGVNSDVTIIALGKEWKLHKLYLCQSGYFNSMFSGSWKESAESCISLNIPDPNITAEALDLAFSSLYRDDVHLEEPQIFSLVAAASMLQLEGLLEHCREFMRETLKPECIIHYLTASSLYGLHEIEEECKEWLRVHLLKSYNIVLLRELSIELLSELLSSPDLYVMQVEMDAYSLAKRWLFLIVNPEWSGEFNKLATDAEKYFRSNSDDESYFLETERGQPYVEVFKAIRLQHILNDITSVETLEADRIIPHSWLQPLYRKQWLKMVLVDQRIDPGPSGLSPEEFHELSFRCGRVISEPGEYCWRWTGFSFGFDVLILYDSSSGLIAVKRNTRSQPCVSAVSLQLKRMLALRLRAVSFDAHGEKCLNVDTGILQLSFSPDEEYPLTTLSVNAGFPLYISINMALASANESFGHISGSSQ